MQIVIVRYYHALCYAAVLLSVQTCYTYCKPLVYSEPIKATKAPLIVHHGTKQKSIISLAGLQI